MMRNCKTDENTEGIGIENPNTAGMGNAGTFLSGKVKEMAEEKGLLDYVSCETPYNFYGGVNAPAHGGYGARITYKNKEFNLERMLKRLDREALVKCNNRPFLDWYVRTIWPTCTRRR
jgi:hypothetical protein